MKVEKELTNTYGDLINAATFENSCFLGFNRFGMGQDFFIVKVDMSGKPKVNVLLKAKGYIQALKIVNDHIIISII